MQKVHLGSRRFSSIDRFTFTDRPSMLRSGTQRKSSKVPEAWLRRSGVLLLKNRGFSEDFASFPEFLIKRAKP